MTHYDKTSLVLHLSAAQPCTYPDFFLAFLPLSPVATLSPESRSLLSEWVLARFRRNI